ncbi:MAG TPA: hypothetical protein VFE62_08635 [Gemmataceae bacterium]|nr:hypothetical protein [Gemmataceae bacterium]
MLRYRYVDSVRPPAPFVTLSLRCTTSGIHLDNQPAIIDPAADRTVLPGPIVRALGLIEDGHLRFQGFASEVVELPIFLVEMRLHDFPPMLVRAALGEHEPYTLLGRDVLNGFRTTLDGPSQMVEIVAPETSS